MLRKILSITLIILYISSCNYKPEIKENLPSPPLKEHKYIIIFNGKKYFFDDDIVFKQFKDSLNIQDTLIKHIE
jgi:hypothetical protein